MLRLAFIIIMGCIPAVVWAGAWPRAEGKTFISGSINFSEDGNGQPDGYRSFYMEYGLTKRLTFGAKSWRRGDGDYGDVMAFATYHLGETKSGHTFSAGLGLGVRSFRNKSPDPVVAPQFSWGKGFETPFMPGWINADLSIVYAPGPNQLWHKADITFGLKPSENTHLIVQLRSHEQPNGKVMALAPSYVRRISDMVSLELGLTYRMKGKDRIGVTLGSWLEF